MAKNLLAKTPASDTLLVHDINAGATARFVDDHPGERTRVKIAGSSRSLAEHSVRPASIFSTIHLVVMSCYVLSMIQVGTTTWPTS